MQIFDLKWFLEQVCLNEHPVSFGMAVLGALQPCRCTNAASPHPSALLGRHPDRARFYRGLQMHY